MNDNRAVLNLARTTCCLLVSFRMRNLDMSGSMPKEARNEGLKEQFRCNIERTVGKRRVPL